jgi:hypothetical protein
MASAGALLQLIGRLLEHLRQIDNLPSHPEGQSAKRGLASRDMGKRHAEAALFAG